MILPLSASESLSLHTKKEKFGSNSLLDSGLEQRQFLSFLLQLPSRIPRAGLNTLPTSHMDINKTGVPVGRTQY